MMNNELNSMSTDALWDLHEKISAELSRKLVAEKNELEKRIEQLSRRSERRPLQKRERRAYPKVSPKFRNPKNRSETWAGRGKQPLWLTAQLRSGKKLEEFRIK